VRELHAAGRHERAHVIELAGRERPLPQV
jgi:hypothetical protein